MENSLLFPSAAALLEKRKKEEPEPASCHSLHGSEFSSFDVDNLVSCDVTHEEYITHRTATDVQHWEDSSNSHLYKSSSEYESSGWESSEDERKKKHKKHKKKHKKKKKRYKFKEVDTPEYQKSEKSSSICNKPDTIWLDESKFDYTNAFRKDIRSDKANYEFNSLYKKDVADFFPLSNCRCLGLTKWQKIILYPKKKKQKRRKTDMFFRYYNYVGKSGTFEEESNEFIHVLESEDFLPLAHKPGKDGKKETSAIMTADPETAYLQKNKLFSQKLTEYPFDISTWLSFVDYQDELVFDKNKDQLNITPKVITEKKMNILEKAILRNPTSSELIIKYMFLANDIWPHNRIQEKWKDILFQIPNRSVLWLRYFLYLQSDILSMNVGTVLDAYRNGFRMLIGIYHGSVLSHPLEDNAEEELLLVFLQMVLFLWLAGHTEKATCCLQCMVELNHFCPQNLVNDDHQMKLSSFEKFFATNLPRFGVPGSCGWNQSIQVPTNIIITPSLEYTTCPAVDFDEELEKLKDTKSKNSLWLILEYIRTANEFLPFNGNHDDCEDTERIVIFDDISFSLFCLSSPELRHQLVLAYLFLLGAPISTRFLHGKVKQCFSVYYLIQEASPHLPCFCHNQALNEYVIINSILLGDKGCPNHKVITAIRTIMSQYLSILKTEKYIRQISQIWLHFESSLFRYEFEKSKDFQKKYWIGMKKFVKSLLKIGANRSCVTLWCMYALYEWNIGNLSDAKKIFFTALQMSHADQDDTIVKVAIIIRVILDIHLDWKIFAVKNSVSQNGKSNILNVCLAFIDSNRILQPYEEEAPNPIWLLKVSNKLKTTYDSIKNPTHAVDFFCCYLTFVYFFRGVDTLIQVTEDIVRSYVNDKEFVDLSDALCYALLLMRSQNSAEAFTAYRRILEECMKIYPDHRKFSFLFNSLKQYGLGGYNARKFYESAMKSANMQPWLYAIDYEERRLKHTSHTPKNDDVELQFLDAQTGVHNRIRALYNKLLRQDEFKHCSTVWMRYLEFQLSYGSKKQASDTLYLALKNCPGVKDLYIFACEKFEEKFDEFLNLIEEKEIRIKLIMEELDILLEA